MKRKVLIFSALGIVAVGLLVAVGLREQSGATAQLSRARTEAGRLGVPLTLAEFQASFLPSSEEEDAWPLYRKAIDIAHPGALNRIPSPDVAPMPRTPIDDLLAAGRTWRRGQFEEPLSEENRALLRSLAPMFEHMRQASLKPVLSFEKDWEGGVLLPVPEFAELMRLCRLALLDATEAAVAGDFDRYRERLETVSRAARQLGQTPLAGGALLACSLSASVADSVQQHVSAGRIGGAHWALLETLVENLGKGMDLRTSIRGYTWMTLATLNVLSSRAKIREYDIDNRFALRNVPKPEQRFETEQRVLADVTAILRRWPTSAEDVPAMRTALGEDAVDIEKSLVEFSPYFRTTPRYEPITEGTLSRLVGAYENFLTRKRLCLCLLTLLAERRQTGAFPPVLEARSERAVDPYTGSPFVYRPQPGGFVLYSLGANRSDDGGVDVRDEKGPADVVTRYPGGGSSL